MFALQHFILPKVIGCLFHLHLYLFNSQKRIYLNTKKEVSKRGKKRYQKEKRRYQKEKKEVSKDKKGSIKRQKKEISRPHFSFLSVIHLFLLYLFTNYSIRTPLLFQIHRSPFQFLHTGRNAAEG